MKHIAGSARIAHTPKDFLWFSSRVFCTSTLSCRARMAGLEAWGIVQGRSQNPGRAWWWIDHDREVQEFKCTIAGCRKSRCESHGPRQAHKVVGWTAFVVLKGSSTYLDGHRLLFDLWAWSDHLLAIWRPERRDWARYWRQLFCIHAKILKGTIHSTMEVLRYLYL